ncbi:MAG: DUF4344 domain-containing metallopeptidase [Myxococcota bacterium]
MRHTIGFLLLIALVMPSQADAAEKAVRPAGLDAEQWAIVQRGMGAMDDAALRSLVWLDANWVMEFRPTRLREMGLWRPLLESLPQSVKAPYEQVTAAMGADPFSRLDSVILAARGARGWGDDEEMVFDGLQFLARGHGGLLTDVARLLAGANAGSGEGKAEDDTPIEMVLAESLSAEAISVLSRPSPTANGDRVLATTARAVVTSEAAGPGARYLSITGPNGVAATWAKAKTDAEALQIAFKLLRRVETARAGAANAPRVEENVLATMKVTQFPTAVGPLDLDLELRLGLQVEVDVRIGLAFEPAPGTGEELRASLLSPADAAALTAEWGAGAWLPLVEELFKRTHVTVSGQSVQFTSRVPTTLLAKVLGGAVFASIDGAAQLGGGVDTAGLLASAVEPPKTIQPFQSQAGAGAETATVYFRESTNPRSQALANVLRTEGSMARLAAALHETLRWPSPVPLEFADCGKANAFYSPKSGSIVFCYELLDDLLAKLAGTIKREYLASALVGAALFIAIHEFGHAMVHKLDLPVTGKQEDAVDQLATLVLLQSGDVGVGYAIAAKLWFDASASAAGPPAYWDVHSTDAQRGFSTMCLIYGSDPTKHARISGSDALPEERAVRCPNEYAQVSRAWSKLLEPHER